jgi:hypothetical protein
MRTLRSKIVIGLLISLFLTAILTMAQSPQSADTLTTLLAEVHALRLAMEQQATVAPRIQLTMSRLNIEEQRMTALSQQLAEVSRQLADNGVEVSRMSAEIADVENQIGRRRSSIEGADCSTQGTETQTARGDGEYGSTTPS